MSCDGNTVLDLGKSSTSSQVDKPSPHLMQDNNDDDDDRGPRHRGFLGLFRRHLLRSGDHRQPGGGARPEGCSICKIAGRQSQTHFRADGSEKSGTNNVLKLLWL